MLNKFQAFVGGIFGHEKTDADADNQLPTFMYHPDPIKTGIIIEKKTHCPVCNKDQDYTYIGPFYSKENIDGICPWCIKTGNAAKKYSGIFQDTTSIEKKIAKKDLDELTQKTPGYSGWQQEMWLVHCEKPCSFIDYVGWKEITDKQEELQQDIESQAEQYHLNVKDFSQNLAKGGYMQGYLFKCVKCGKLRLTTDIN